MACRTTFIEGRRRAGYTLMEMMVGILIGAIIFAAAGDLSIYTGRMFAAMTNYVDLDSKSRHALDRMTQEIRQANFLSSATSNQLIFCYNGATNLSYTYDPVGQTLTRTNGADTEVLLTGCSTLTFSMYQRNPLGGSFEQFPAAVATNTKLVMMTWTCNRSILGHSINSESVQSAKIVIRK